MIRSSSEELVTTIMYNTQVFRYALDFLIG